MTDSTHMRREIEEIPAAVRRLLAGEAARAAEIGAALGRKDPLVVVTIARGSSDHAAAYLAYAIELTLGLPVASIGPSIASVYRRRLELGRAAAVSISQSGKSPDIVAMASSARAGGALTLALTNNTASPLAAAADFAVDLSAGPERSVAATKSFVSSIVAGLMVLGHWSGEAGLLAALAGLPEALGNALRCDWSPLQAALEGRDSLYVLGRGPSAAIAAEAALKFKETCGIHAEGYSAAEVAHGPARIVEAGYPVLALAARDEAERSVVGMADRLGGQGAQAFVTTGLEGAAARLPFVATGHPLTDPLPLVVSFYAFVEQLSRHLGFDPDAPPHLNKVTETL